MSKPTAAQSATAAANAAANWSPGPVSMRSLKKDDETGYAAAAPPPAGAMANNNANNNNTGGGWSGPAFKRVQESEVGPSAGSSSPYSSSSSLNYKNPTGAVSMRGLKMDAESGFAMPTPPTSQPSSPMVQSRQQQQASQPIAQPSSKNPFTMSTDELAVYLGIVVQNAVIRVKLTGKVLLETPDEDIKNALGTSIAKLFLKNRESGEFVSRVSKMDNAAVAKYLGTEIQNRVVQVKLTGSLLKLADPEDITEALGQSAAKEVKRLQQQQ